MKHKNPIAIISGWLALVLAPTGAGAEAIGTGTIEGRVLNGTSGSYLNNARVAVDGTTLETFTNENGDYRLSRVRPGELRITASFNGLASETTTVTVSAGTISRKDLELSLPGATRGGSGEIVTLGAFTVQERQLTAQALATNEQHFAPNIKNVIAIDVDLGEGNVGEFLKYVPGVYLGQNPQSPGSASIRGMPDTGTLVTTNGMEVAANGITGRATDISLAATGNIDRIEVTKVPTPDMPANAVGGGVNMITKSGFSRKTPLFSYNLFGTLTTMDGPRGPGPIFGRSDGPDAKSDMSRINPSINLSYLFPVNKSVALAFSLSKSDRYNDWIFQQQAWNKVTLRIANDSITSLLVPEHKLLAATTLDLKLNNYNAVSINVSHSTQNVGVRSNRLTHTFGTGSLGDATFAQGTAAGVGSASMVLTWNDQYKDLNLYSVSYRHDGPKWKIDAGVAFSRAGTRYRDLDDGFFNSGSTTLANLVLRDDGLDQIAEAGSRKIAAVTAATRTGAPIDIHDGRLHSVTTVGSSPQDIVDEMRRAALNIGRDLSFSFPVALKAGAVISRRHNDADAGARTWTFSPPGGTAAQVAGNYDLVNDKVSPRSVFTDTNGKDVPVNWVNLAKLKRAFDANPQWFVFNAPAAYISKATLTKTIEETISAAYLRGDIRLFENRLWMVGGIRFERTTDEGWGPLNDVRGTYVQDANGNLVRDASGRLIRKTTDALQLAQLQYTVKGTHTKRSYQGYYPSFNASYSITPNIIARAAYARTIGRPNFPEIIPGITAADPDAAVGNRTVTVINTALKPWSANNYDLSLETYELKGAVASVSLFQKDLNNFFGSIRTPATSESLAALGLNDTYLGYDIVTKRNVGQASIRGIELSYRQSFAPFLPAWGKGIQGFAMLTSMALRGPNADDLTFFTPRTSQWGVSFTNRRFDIRVSVNQVGWTRRTPVNASSSIRPNSYNMYAPQTKTDVSVGYMFSRHYTLYAAVRNLWGIPLRGGNYSPDTPVFARIDALQFPGAMFNFGLKGDF